MSPILKIISFTRSFWRWYLFLSVFVLAISLLNLASPLLGKQIVDIIVAKLQGEPQDLSRIIFLFILIIASDITITTATAFGQWIGDIFTTRLQTHLARTFYEHLLNLDIEFYDNHITGQIVNKMYRGISSITDFIQNMSNNFLPFFLTAFVTILLLSRYSLAIALLLTILFPAYILISHSSTLSWKTFEDRKNQISDLSQGRVFESISGIRIVKSFTTQLQEIRSFLSSRTQIEDLTTSQTRLWHLYDFARRLTLNLILFAIYVYIVYWTFHSRFTIGEMTLMLQLVNQARFPLFAMSFILGQIQQASSGSKDFFSLIETRPHLTDLPHARKLNPRPRHSPTIEFSGVSFHYQPHSPVLRDLSFTLNPREKLALVGESGQGKSTIVNLLLRFYSPQKGTIRVWNQDISRVTQTSLHSQVAVVFQDPFLFSGSVRENIAYSSPTATDRQIIAAARAANAHEFISKLPDGYNSLIGERGVKLSGGQKQRIAIARAILKDAPLVILDEATSSLDSKSEILVQEGLNRLLKNRTSIVIAHRLATITNADHILVISGGRTAQYGTPAELMRDKNGLYYQLVTLQKELFTLTPEARQAKLKQFDLVA